MKSIKIKKGKRYIVAWIFVILMFFGLWIGFSLSWNNYRKAQDHAIEITKTLFPEFRENETNSRSELISEMYFFYNNFWNDPYSKQIYSAKTIKEHNESVVKARALLSNALFDLGYSGGDYYFKFDSMDSFLFSGRYSGIRIILLLSVMAAVATALFLTIRYVSDKSELAIDENQLIAKRRNGDTIKIFLRDVTNVELSGENGLIVRGNSFHYHIGGIQNAEELNKAILENLSKASNQTLDKDVHMDESTADELRRLKELLDEGILTQDEFDAKKELLLGLK